MKWIKINLNHYLCLFVFTCSIPLQIFSETMRVPNDRYKLKDWETFKNITNFYPYLCEFAYRSLADHVIDPNHPTFDPLDVKPGDSIYCAVWYLEWFVNQIHDKIPHPYILITCDVGSYLPATGLIKLVYDPKLVYWFGKNMLFTNHPKFFQLPMGQFYYLWAKAVEKDLDVFNDLVLNPIPPEKKDIFLYLNYTERNHGRRIMVADKFAKESYCYDRNRPRRYTSLPTFWKEASRAKFVLSPLGLEIDCTRTWECFALGAIPIVEHSFLDSLYDELPILLVHDWDEVNKEFLNQKYLEISSKNHNLKKTFIDYWADLIHEKQETIRRGDLTSSSLEATQFTPEDLNEIKNILQYVKKQPSFLVFQGNMTCLRPFQLAKEIPSIKNIQIVDLWTQTGHSLIKKFIRDSSLLNFQKVNICNTAQKNRLLKVKKQKAVFLDLTHFRHKLLNDLSQLNNFSHSLEGDIFDTYRALFKDDLLFGNTAKDPYVQQVIERLEQKHHLNIKVSGNFWHCVKP